jgi:hypothetical protein
VEIILYILDCRNDLNFRTDVEGLFICLLRMGFSGTTPPAMEIKASVLTFFVGFLFLCGAGCGKSDIPPSVQPSSGVPPEVIARLHWVGRKCLGTNVGAFYFMRLWELPEALRLQAQTLDKLSLTPWRMLSGPTTVPNISSGLLRSLLDDVVQEETCLEFREVADQSSEMVFAIRLNSQRASVWETNLAAIVGSLSSIAPTIASTGGRGWDLKDAKRLGSIKLRRVGEWTLLGAARDKNPLLAEFARHIQRNGNPFPERATNYWLKIDLDSDRLASALGFRNSSFQKKFRNVSVTILGDGANVITEGNFFLSEALPLPFEMWQIPSNLVHEPLASFTAVRGIRSWMNSINEWNDLKIGSPPNQFFSWAPGNAPLETYCAIPLPDASGGARTIMDALLRNGPPWVASHGIGNLLRSEDSNSVTWTGLPLVTPFIRSTNDGSTAFLFAGSLPPTTQRTSPPPAQIIQDLVGATNVTYYQWELTDERIEAFLDLGQVLRLALRGKQLPLESAGAAWLNSIRQRVGPCNTSITGDGTNRLVLNRKSTIGLNGLELHLLVQWLESTEFPAFDTFSTPFRDGIKAN